MREDEPAASTIPANEDDRDTEITITEQGAAVTLRFVVAVWRMEGQKATGGGACATFQARVSHYRCSHRASKLPLESRKRALILRKKVVKQPEKFIFRPLECRFWDASATTLRLYCILAI
jgi:hypothetical protein